MSVLCVCVFSCGLVLLRVLSEVLSDGRLLVLFDDACAFENFNFCVFDFFMCLDSVSGCGVVELLIGWRCGLLCLGFCFLEFWSCGLLLFSVC